MLWEISIFLADMNKVRLEIKKGGGDSKFVFGSKKHVLVVVMAAFPSASTNLYNRFGNFSAFETGEISSALLYWN